MRHKKFRTKTTPSVKSRQVSRRGASFHPWREQGCPSKKLGFPTQKEAWLYVRQIGKELQPYQCPDCGAWHLGTISTFNFWSGAVAYLESQELTNWEVYRCAVHVGKFHVRPPELT